MSSLGFDNYVEPLKLYLQKYREANKGDKAIAVGAAVESGESSASASAFGGETVTVEDPSANAQGSTVVFAYDLGHGHVQVQPTTTSAGNGANYTVG